MKFLPMKGLLDHAVENNYAVPSFCVWNAEVMQSVLRVAQRMEAPVILMNGPGEFGLLPPLAMAQIARGLAESYNVKAALHLDHGNSLDIVKDCIAADYTSVMLDFSTRPFEENANALKTVSEWAHPKGITVEGEIGAVGKVDPTTPEGDNNSKLTNPDEAIEYVKISNVDCLAVSIGNAHGNYIKLPKLNFSLLEKIHKVIDLPLVLHGGTGTPDEDLKKAISLGIAKVNVATALITAIRETCMEQWNKGENFWIPYAMEKAIAKMEKVVEEWIIRVGADGKA